MSDIPSAAQTTGPPPGTPVSPAIPTSRVQIKSLPAELNHLNFAAAPAVSAARAAPLASFASHQPLEVQSTYGEASEMVEKESQDNLLEEAESEDAGPSDVLSTHEQGQPFLVISFGCNHYAVYDDRSPASDKWWYDEQRQEPLPVRKQDEQTLAEQPLDALFQLLRTTDFFENLLQDDTELLLDFSELDLQLTEVRDSAYLFVSCMMQ